MYGFVASPGRIARTIVVGQKSGLVRRILYILTYFIRCNEVYENVETMLCPDPDTSIFSVDQREKDDASKLEDKIVKQLISTSLTNNNNNNSNNNSSTTTTTTATGTIPVAVRNIDTEHVESIATPKTSSSYHHHHNYHTTAGSPDSLNDPIIGSPSASFSSRISAIPTSSAGPINNNNNNNRWSTTTTATTITTSGDSSFDPPSGLPKHTNVGIDSTTSSTASSLDTMNGIYGKLPPQSPQRQSSLDPVTSANGIYPVVMPK